MKGIEPITILVGFTIGILMLFVPLLATTIHLVQNINFESQVNNAQLTLLALLSSTYQGKQISQIIAEAVQQNQYRNLDEILSIQLNKITDCYKLSTPSKVLAQSKDCTPTKYTASTLISLPFSEGKMAEKIILVMN